MAKSNSINRITSIRLDKLHILLILLIFILFYLNINLKYSYQKIQKDLTAFYSDEESLESGFETSMYVKPQLYGPVFESDKGYRTRLTVGSGDTLHKMLIDVGVAPQDSANIATAIDSIQKASQLKIGQQLVITFATDEEVERLKQKYGPYTIIQKTEDEYYAKAKTVQLISDERMITIVHDEQKNTYDAKVHNIPFVSMENVFVVNIQNSIYADSIKTGASPTIIMDMINKLSYDVDFQRDIKEGDQFGVYYNSFKNENGKKLRDGELLYAFLKANSKKIEIFRYEDGEYYDRFGQSIKRTLLRTPINGAKITSGFGKRMHPILGFSRMHKGLDYGAPKGTPILAAGDGVVELIKYSKNGYGKYIKIKHTPKYATLYGHLDSFAKGIKPGSRISQGDVIGYVGATGLASGPHLHYEVHENNQQINPAKISFAKSPGLVSNKMFQFKQMVQNIDKKFEEKGLID